MANQIGKRYVCAKCGAELIVTKGGAGASATLWSAHGAQEIVNLKTGGGQSCDQ